MKEIIKGVLLLAIFVVLTAGCSNTNKPTGDNREQQGMAEKMGRPGEGGEQQGEKGRPGEGGEQRGEKGRPGEGGEQRGEMGKSGNNGPKGNKGQPQ